MAESRPAVLAAVIGNGAIAATKFTAAALGGSSAMISEGIHSVVDMGNGTLLLLGKTRARQPADESHPFGHGQELYFWTLIVAISIFGIGGGMSAYEGVTHIFNPVELTDPTLSYITLGISMVFELVSFSFAVRGFVQAKGDRGWLEGIREGKDPSVFTVLLEDAAAITGLLFAAAGIWLTHVTGDPLWDGSASIAIGLLLMSSAVLLATESRRLLIGEAAERETVRDIRTIVASDEAVAAAGAVLTMHMGPEDVLANIGVRFRAGLSTEQMTEAARRIEERVRRQHHSVTKVFFDLNAAETSSGQSQRAETQRKSNDRRPPTSTPESL